MSPATRPPIPLYRGDDFEHTFVFRWAEWNRTAEYVTGQTVRLGDHSYTAIVDNVRVRPTADPATWTDNGAGTTRIDVSARTFRAQLRRRSDLDSTVLITFAVDASGAADGEVKITATNDETRVLPRKGTYKMDAQYVDAGKVITFVSCDVEASGEVTADA